jgi:hypothetical protein
VTAESQPTLSLQSRTVDGVTNPGADGNPKSKATDELQVPATGSPGWDHPDFSKEAGDLGGAG